jgi:hypothetical protein
MKKLGQQSGPGIYRLCVRRDEVLLCRRELEAQKKSELSFEQAREELIEKLSERLLKLLLEINRMETERLLPYTVFSISDFTDDLSTAHYVYLQKHMRERTSFVVDKGRAQEALREVPRTAPLR